MLVLSHWYWVQRTFGHYAADVDLFSYFIYLTNIIMSQELIRTLNNSSSSLNPQQPMNEVLLLWPLFSGRHRRNKEVAQDHTVSGRQSGSRHHLLYHRPMAVCLRAVGQPNTVLSTISRDHSLCLWESSMRILCSGDWGTQWKPEPLA